MTLSTRGIHRASLSLISYQFPLLDDKLALEAGSDQSTSLDAYKLDNLGLPNRRCITQNTSCKSIITAKSDCFFIQVVCFQRIALQYTSHSMKQTQESSGFPPSDEPNAHESHEPKAPPDGGLQAWIQVLCMHLTCF